MVGVVSDYQDPERGKGVYWEMEKRGGGGSLLSGWVWWAKRRYDLGDQEKPSPGTLHCLGLHCSEGTDVCWGIGSSVEGPVRQIGRASCRERVSRLV